MSDNAVSVARRSEVLEALANRRSLIKLGPKRPDAELIRALLGAAIRAPNHHRTEPWRFIVLAGSARERLGDVFAECARARVTLLPSAAADALVEAERRKPLRGPVLIVVACVRSTENPKAMPIEDVEATAAAVENLLIAAQAFGLAAAWRTGERAYDDPVKLWLGLRPEDDIVAFVYVGYASIELPPLTARKPLDAVVRWEGWETSEPAAD